METEALLWCAGLYRGVLADARAGCFWSQQWVRYEIDGWATSFVDEPDHG